MKEGVESTLHTCQTPTARGQAGGDLGVNHERRRGNSAGAAWRGPKKWDLTDFSFCFLFLTRALWEDDGGVKTSRGSELTSRVQQLPEEKRHKLQRSNSGLRFYTGFFRGCIAARLYVQYKRKIEDGGHASEEKGIDARGSR